MLIPLSQIIRSGEKQDNPTTLVDRLKVPTLKTSASCLQLNYTGLTNAGEYTIIPEEWVAPPLSLICFVV